MADCCKDRALRPYAFDHGYELAPRTTKKEVYNRIAEVAPSLGEFHPEDPLPAAVAHFEAFIKQSEFDKPYYNKSYPEQELLWDDPTRGPRKRDWWPTLDNPDPVQEVIDNYGVAVVFNAYTEDKFCPGEAVELTFNTTEPFTGFQVLFAEAGTTVTLVRQPTDNQVVLEIDADINQRNWVRIVFYMRTVEGITGDAILNVERQACGHYAMVKMGDHCTVYDIKNDKVATDVIDNAGTGVVVFPAAYSATTNWRTNYAISNESGDIWTEVQTDDGDYLTVTFPWMCAIGTRCYSARNLQYSSVDGYNAWFDEDCSGVCEYYDSSIPHCPPASIPPFDPCCLDPQYDQYDLSPCDYDNSWPKLTSSSGTSVFSESDCNATVMSNSADFEDWWYEDLIDGGGPGDCPRATIGATSSCISSPKGEAWVRSEYDATIHGEGSGNFWNYGYVCNFPNFLTTTENIRKKLDKTYDVKWLGYQTVIGATDYGAEDLVFDQDYTFYCPLGTLLTAANNWTFYIYYEPDCFTVGAPDPDPFPASYENSTASGFNRAAFNSYTTGHVWENAVNRFSEKTQLQIYAVRLKKYTMTTGGNIALDAACGGVGGCAHMQNNGCYTAIQDWESDTRYNAYRSEAGYFSGLMAQCEYFPSGGASNQGPCSASRNATFETALNGLITYYYTQEGLGANDVPAKTHQFEVDLYTFSKRT